MKKVISILLFILLISSFNISAFAKQDAEVFASETIVKKDEMVLIPVNIKNNSGIMGYKISLSCPGTIIINSIIQGNLSQKGNFNYNIAENSFSADIIWNYTEDIKIDGTLFLIDVTATEEINEAAIKVSYSSDDTFNENWEDVKLNCKDIILKGKDVATTISTTNKMNETMSTDSVDSQIISIIDVSLNQCGFKNINEARNDKMFIKTVNENLNTVTGQSERFLDFDSIQKQYIKSYKTKFSEDAKSTATDEEINEIIDECLKLDNSKNIDKVNDKHSFVKNVENKLRAINSDTMNISEDIDDDSSIKIIKDLYSEKNTSTAIILIIVFIILISFSMIALYKIKQKKND